MPHTYTRAHVYTCVRIARCVTVTRGSDIASAQNIRGDAICLHSAVAPHYLDPASPSYRIRFLRPGGGKPSRDANVRHDATVQTEANTPSDLNAELSARTFRDENGGMKSSAKSYVSRGVES